MAVNSIPLNILVFLEISQLIFKQMHLVMNVRESLIFHTKRENDGRKIYYNVDIFLQKTELLMLLVIKTLKCS